MCPPLALPLPSPWPRRRELQCHCRDKVNNVFACRWCIRARAPGAGWLCCVLRHGQYPPREATGGRDAPRRYDLLFVAAAGGCTLTLVLKLVLGRKAEATEKLSRGRPTVDCSLDRPTHGATSHGWARCPAREAQNLTTHTSVQVVPWFSKTVIFTQHNVTYSHTFHKRQSHTSQSGNRAVHQ